MTPLVAHRIEEIRRCIDGDVRVVRDEGDRVLICLVPHDRDLELTFVLVDPRNWREAVAH